MFPLHETAFLGVLKDWIMTLIIHDSRVEGPLRLSEAPQWSGHIPRLYLEGALFSLPQGRSSAPCKREAPGCALPPLLAALSVTPSKYCCPVFRQGRVLRGSIAEIHCCSELLGVILGCSIWC